MRNCAPSPSCSELHNRTLSWCDFRAGCIIAYELLPDNSDLAQTVLSSLPHLAEALLELGVTDYGKSSIDMALAVQEARTDPPPSCCCRKNGSIGA